MTAIYVESGLYRVRGAGIDQLVIAQHGCDAIGIMFERLLP